MTGCTVLLDPASTEATMLIDTGHNAMLYQAGTWTAPRNITVLGGYWNRGAVGGATFNGRHTFILGGSHITVRGAAFHSTSAQYALCLQNITDFVIDDLFMDTVDSDGVHIQGPAARGTITRVHGTSRDDLISITPVDCVTYTWGNEGDVTDILIDGVQGNNCETNIVKVLTGSISGTPVNTRRIVVRNVSGTLTTGATTGGVPISGVYIGDDIAQANTSLGQLHDVLVDGVSVVGMSNTPLIYVPGNSSSRLIKSLVVQNVYVQSDCAAVVKVAGQVDSLTVGGVTGTTATAPIGDGIVWVTGRASRVRLSHVDMNFEGAADGAIVKADSRAFTINDIAVSNIRTAGVAQGFDLGTDTGLHLVNRRMMSNSILGYVRSTAKLTISGSGLDLASGTIQEQVSARTDTVTNTSGTATINDTAITAGDLNRRVIGTGVPADVFVGNIVAGTSFQLQDANGNPVNTTAAVTSVRIGGALIAHSFEIPVDATLGSLLPSTGDRLLNTNGSAAGGVGPAMYTGSAWARVV